MATHPPRQPLQRLLIPPSLSQQQPVIFAENAPMFSPALPTSIQMGMHPPFPNPHHPMQTPMQHSFFPQGPPGAPARPHMQHRAHPSMAQLAAAGILPPPGVPITPLGQGAFPPMLTPGPFPQQFVPRSKRGQSISTGGPPKAVLGGPQRKVSPLPVQPAPVPAPAAPTQKRKMIVNLPKETVREEGSEAVTRAAWARTPLPPSEVQHQPDVKPPELTSTDAYPPDSWRRHIPPSVDVFLPGKSAWDAIKHQVIEEKLEKLGVEKGTGSAIPHIHAPHARAASISSPADPALLFFKLNKLQQSQNASAANSLSTSPQPPPNLASSPGGNPSVPPRFQNRHGHSMSLAQPPSFQPLYNPAAAFNPFGPTATLGSDQIFNRVSPGPRPQPIDVIHAPQGRVPANVSSLAPPASSSRPESRPDFLRGFGVEIPEEEEPEEEEEEEEADGDANADAGDVSRDEEDVRTEAGDVSRAESGNGNGGGEGEGEDEGDFVGDGMSTVAQSRVHSRHVSKLSAALSLRSVGRMDDVVVLESGSGGPPAGEVVPVRDAVGGVEVDELDREAVGEWTGSEDLRTSDDESIGEWSNPSDEERARQQRLHRRAVRRAKQIQQDLPRRLPNFPRPPESGTSFVPDLTDDDVISNPSEEERVHMQDLHRPRSNLSGRGRPLPPLPHSRSTSAQYSFHDPALAHSRQTSEFSQPGGLQPRPPRTESLNPLAKPFVFGTPLSHPPATAPVTTTTFAHAHAHARTPSFGKPLNAAAQEFKPGGFTFKPPPGVPQLHFVSPPPAPAPRPLPTPPAVRVSPVRATQGREKRQRRGSSASFAPVDVEDEDGDGNDTMSSFKFPPSADVGKLMRHSAPASPPGASAVEFGGKDSAKPFTFSGFSSSSLSLAGQEAAAAAEVNGEDGHGDSTIKAEGGEPEPRAARELPFPPTASKPKRAPIPLDFKHPLSTNTVPAGLFKALANSDHSEERTRRTVRSRLSSRDIFEHSQRPSLDDVNMPGISQRVVRVGSSNRMFTDPGYRETLSEREDLFSSPRRRSSLPPRHSGMEDSMSDVSVLPMNLSRRVEMQQYEQRIEALLEEKMDGLRSMLEDFKRGSAAGVQGMNASTEAMIAEVVSLFRTQLQESAARSLEDSQMDARGELDFEVLKGIIEQGHAETRAQLLYELTSLLNAHGTGSEVRRWVGEVCDKTLHALGSYTDKITLHMHAVEKLRSSPAGDREAIVRDLMGFLSPHLAALRPEPIDYEGLTAQLTQAVKPHIAQLIDLASDKRETAGLIVDRLVPILPSLYPPAPELDMESIVGRLTTEVRKIVGPLDAHEMKEQVSDLVVERLDSRLAVRDKTFNVDVVTEKVTESVSGLLEPLKDLKSAVEAIGKNQHAPSIMPMPELDLSSLRQDVLSLLSDLPDRLATASGALESAVVDLKSQKGRVETDDAPITAIRQFESALAAVADDQKKLVSQNSEFSDFCQDIIKHINALPEAMLEATKVLQNAHADIIARDTSQSDAEQIRRLMANSSELQVQLAKARGAHGQVRVEKDMLAERLRSMEAEREKSNAKLEEAQAALSAKVAETAATEARNSELEEALAQALERIKSSDVATQTSQERIAALEKKVSELTGEKQTLKSKVDSLQLNTEVAIREKASIADELAYARRQNEELSSQQNHWDDLRRTSEQIEALAALVEHGDKEEIRDLRRTRDRFKVLEGEHAALQRRFKDQEHKMANNERAAASARQSLTQAQQRAVEWEKRAKDYEHELDSTRSKLDQSEQAQSQLDADLSLLKLQLEERDAEERLTQDREGKLRDQIAHMEEQAARLQAEADQAKKAADEAKAAAKAAIAKAAAAKAAPSYPSTLARHQQNGYARSAVSPARPHSRASTIYGDSRVVTPSAQVNGAHTPSVEDTSPPQPSVWDSIHAPPSIHAPTAHLPITPKAAKRPLQPHYRPRIPSPTPSNVSAAPTLQNDGWWE